MSTRHVAGEDPLRVKPVKQPWPPGLSWVGWPAAWALVLTATLALGGGLWWGMRERGAFVKPKTDLPAKPQLELQLANAQQRLKEDPQDLRTLVELGTLSFERGKDSYPDAVNYLEEARKLGALDPRIFYCLGIMYQELGLYPYALAEYRRFLRNHPEDKEIRMMTAKLLYRQGSFIEAVSEYERLKFNSPGDKLIEENLGLSLWGAKELDRAAEVFGQLKPAGGAAAKRAEFYLGQILFEKGDVPAALEHLKQGATALGTEDIGVAPEKMHAALAMAYQKLGMAPEARESWQAVLKLVPGDSKAAAMLRDLNRKYPVKKPAKKSLEK